MRKGVGDDVARWKGVEVEGGRAVKVDRSQRHRCPP